MNQKRIRTIILSCLLIAPFWSISQGPGINHLKDLLKTTTSQDSSINYLLQIGELYASINVDSSIHYLEMSYHLAKLGEDSQHLYKITNALGLMYEDVNSTKSAQYYYECLSIVESRKDRMKLLPIIWLNVGTLHRKNDEFDKALEYFNLSLDARTAENDSLGMAECYNNIGTAYMASDQLEDGLRFWNLALGIKIRHDDRLSAANTMLNLGIYYKDSFKYDLAFKNAFKALTIFEEFGHLEYVANTYALIGATWFGKKNWKKAIQNYDKANDIFLDLQLEEPRIDVLNGLGKALYEDGQSDRAREIFGKWEYLFTAYQKDESAKHIIEIATKYETEKKEKEIILLKKENELKEIQNLATAEEVKRKDLQRNFLVLSLALLLAVLALFIYITIQRKKSSEKLKIQKDLVQEKNAEIEVSLREKEVLLKEIHHRVKNNLEIISSLIELQTEGVQDQKTADIFTSWQNRINSIALIHRDLYQTDNFIMVDLKDYFEHLVSNIRNVYGTNSGVVINLDVKTQINLHIDQTIPLGLIVNELISNSFKHAFKETKKGEIKVHISNSNEDNIVVVVSDNGEGLKNRDTNKESDSLGLRLVKILSRQINAQLSITSENGTCTEVVFKPTT